MPLGMAVDLGPGHIVLDGDPAARLFTKKGHTSPIFGPYTYISIVAKRLDGSRCRLVRRLVLVQATLCYMGTQLPLKGVQSPNFQPMSIVAKLVDESKCHLERR